MGELTIARERFEQSLALYRPEMHDSQIAQYGTDLGVAGHCYHALTLWHLGYPDQAVEESYRSITLAQDGAHPFSQAYALFVSAWVHHLRRDVSATQTQAEAAIRLATEQELPYWAALSGLMRGWSLALQGEGTGQKMSGTLLLSMLAEAYGRNGQREAEQTVLTEALELVDENDERAYDARVYQLQGELSLQGKEAQFEEAEASLQKALNVARQQEAKSFELRAATSLARLWQRQGKTTEAHELLTPVYNWFTEGFDTADLKDAKALLAELT